MYRYTKEEFQQFVDELWTNMNAWAHEVYDDERIKEDEMDIISDAIARCADLVETTAECYGVRVYEDTYIGEE